MKEFEDYEAKRREEKEILREMYKELKGKYKKDGLDARFLETTAGDRLLDLRPHISNTLNYLAQAEELYFKVLAKRKELLSATLKEAVRATHEKYDNFQGVCVFGSFATDKVETSDIDLIPILKEYGSSWNFSPASECDDEDDHPDYYKYRYEIREFFGAQFENLAKQYGYDKVFRTMRIKNALLHIESLVALDQPDEIKSTMDHYQAQPHNLIATDEAHQVIMGAFLGE